MAEPNIVGSLFGVTPELYQEQRDLMRQKQAMAFAQQDPRAQATYGLYRAGQQVGGALGGLMGAEDPQMRLISQRNALAKQFDVSTPEGLAQYGQALQQVGDTQGALGAISIGRQMTQEMALTGQRQAAERSSLATAAKTELSIEQENKLRNELSQLPPDATQEQVLGVITKYGSPDKILAVLQGTADKAAANQARIDAANAANQARIDAAKVAADARIEAAKLAGATALQIAQLRADSARELRQLTTSLKGPKVLAPSLQKEEDKNKRLAELHEQEFRLENENFIIDRVDPNFNDKLDDMVEVLVKDMKVPKETAIAFRNDPFYYRREILVDLVRRVELKRKDVEIAKLKKKPTDILDRIEKLSGKKPLKPSSLKKRNLGEDEEEIDNGKIANLDDKALQKYLEEGKE